MAREQRRLAAIVAADVVGYSRLMGRDESGTLAALKALRRGIVDPQIDRHGGRIVKTTGDGLLLDFASVVDAVHCVIAVQQAMVTHNVDIPVDRRIEFRVGVNIGDIIVDGDDIFGDGVNVAARLQEIAAPGGVCLSGRVQEDVRGKLDVTLEDIGEQQLKNIAWPVRVWRVQGLGTSAAAPAASATGAPPTAVGERAARPALAVLPFDNMGGDATLENFCDGLTEDLITSLSTLRWVHVVSRKSSFAYKGRSPDIRHVARDLGVTYVLEGSVRQIGGRVRINAQLINARTGNHAWARRYDRDYADPFALQDQIVGNVAGSLHYVLWYGLVRGEDGAGPPDPAANPLRAAVWHLTQFTAKDIDQVIAYAGRALAINAGSVAANQYLHLGYASRLFSGWSRAPVSDLAAAVDAARRAVALSPADGLSQALYGSGLALARQRNEALARTQRALALDGWSAHTLGPAACAMSLAGEPRDAIDLIDRVLDIVPTHYGRGIFLTYLALNWLRLGAPDRGLPHAEEAAQLKPEMIATHVGRAAMHGALGRMEDARAALAAATERRPGLDAVLVDAMLPYSEPADSARLMEALRAAGLENAQGE